MYAVGQLQVYEFYNLWINNSDNLLALASIWTNVFLSSSVMGSTCLFL
jgi:hypothetical protein